MICSFLAGLHGTRQEEMIDHRLTDREWAEEWKHLDHVRAECTSMCNCLKGALLRKDFFFSFKTNLNSSVCFENVDI